MPSMTTAEAEALLGPRGALRVTKENRPTVKKWFVAQAFPSLFVGGLSYTELGLGYNDTSGRELTKLRTKLAAAVADGAETEDEDESSLPPPPQVQTAPQTGRTIDQLIRDLIAATATRLDPDAVRQIVREEMSGTTARRIEVKLPDGATSKIEGRVHPLFEELLAYAVAGQNVMLVGPAGCGKTTVVAQVAKALERRFGMISCSGGMSESQVMGWRLPVNDMRFEYVPSEFVECYEGGNSTFLFDEADAADGNMMVCLNAATANGHMSIPHRVEKPLATRGENVWICLACNTYGTGADPVYAGRNQQDGAFSDRFVVVEMDYDRELERDIARGLGLSDAQIKRVWEVREKVQKSGIPRVISTRAFGKIASVMAATKCNFENAMSRLALGWSGDERRQAGL